MDRMFDIKQSLGVAKLCVLDLECNADIEMPVEGGRGPIRYTFRIEYTYGHTTVTDSWHGRTTFSGFNPTAAVSYIETKVKAYKRVVSDGLSLLEEAAQMAEMLNAISLNTDGKLPFVRGARQTYNPEIVQYWLGLANPDNKNDLRGWIASHNVATNKFALHLGQVPMDTLKWVRAGKMLEELARIDQFVKILHDPRIFREKEDGKGQREKAK
jgi:hypothetical protein